MKDTILQIFKYENVVLLSLQYKTEHDIEEHNYTDLQINAMVCWVYRSVGPKGAERSQSKRKLHR